MIKESLHNLLLSLIREFELAYAMVALPSGEVIEEIGDVTRISRLGLYGSLVGSAEAIRCLWESLEGQVLPRLWAQGPLGCIVLKYDGDLLVVLFDDMNRSAIEDYRISKEIAKRLECTAHTLG